MKTEQEGTNSPFGLKASIGGVRKKRDRFNEDISAMHRDFYATWQEVCNTYNVLRPTSWRFNKFVYFPLQEK